MPLAGRTVLQMDQAAPANQTLIQRYRERRQDPGLDRCVDLRPRRHPQKAPRHRRQSRHNLAGPKRHSVRENAAPTDA